MHTFPEMMAKLMAGTFDMLLPDSIERAGVCTPAMLLRVGKEGSPFSSTLLEATAMTMENIDEYVQRSVLGNPKIMAMAAEAKILGRTPSCGGAPIEAEDLIMVRLSWNLYHVDCNLAMRSWYCSKSALSTNKATGNLEILWPEMNSETATFWPVRHLRHALKLALISGAMRALPAPKH